MRPSSAVRWLTILSLGVGAGTLAFGGAILLDMRNDARSQAEQASDNLTMALARDIARNIMLYDLSVQGAIDAWDRADIQQVSSETRRMTLFDRAASADYLGSLAILDDSGIVVANSTGTASLQPNSADRDYFRVHKDRVDAGLYVSRPIRSPLLNEDLSIAISRRIFGHDGRFGGIVVGTMRLAFFQDLFSKLDVGFRGRVTLFRSDGRLIMRSPPREADIDRDYSGSAIFRHYLTSSTGHLVDTAADGVQRLFTYRHIGNLPLILSVAISTADIYARWWRKAVAVGVALTALCGAATVLLVLFRREISHRIAAEQKLAVVASTDGLTGIANRRSCELTLKNEWRRAIRAESPIALIMLDVDFFKAFNDTYGHPAGDHVLQAVADSIVQSIRRPHDMAGRYGGEEFVALLPDADMAGALNVAARICAAVADLGMPHVGSPLGCVTVSIGIAVVFPAHGEREALLVKQADEALYEAKRSGRNRVCAGAGNDRPGVHQMPAMNS
jgi:diguanylate cyclase (GGDEF)-like protein